MISQTRGLGRKLDFQKIDADAARPVPKCFIRRANSVWKGCSRREQGVRRANCSVDGPILRYFELCDV